LLIILKSGGPWPPSDVHVYRMKRTISEGKEENKMPQHSPPVEAEPSILTRLRTLIGNEALVDVSGNRNNGFS